MAAATAIRLEREALWIHRRTERFTFLDGRRLRKSIDIELTVPSNFTTSSSDGPAILPVAQPTKRFMRGFTMIDECGQKLMSVTRDENAAVSTMMLVQNAKRVLGNQQDLPEGIVADFADVAGLRWHPEDYPDDVVRARRRDEALSKFRQAWAEALELSEPEETQRDVHEVPVGDHLRSKLWGDEVMRSSILQRAERFVLLVPGLGTKGARRKLTIEYEWELDPHADEAAPQISKTLTGRIGVAVSRILRAETIDHTVNIPTRGPFSASSYHAEVLAPEDLTVVGARLQLVTTLRANGKSLSSSEEVASDRSTPLIHLHANGRRPAGEIGVGETWQVCVVRARLRVRAGLVLPVVLTGSIVAAALTGGIIAHVAGLKALSDPLAAVLLALPALYAAYLLPQGHALMRRLFIEFRFILVILALLPYAAAATVAIDFGSTTRWIAWILLDLVAIACLIVSSSALRKALRVTLNLAST
jgi:hypothetical protein